MGDRNIRVPGLGETMAETRGIYAYTPENDLVLGLSKGKIKGDLKSAAGEKT